MPFVALALLKRVMRRRVCQLVTYVARFINKSPLCDLFRGTENSDTRMPYMCHVRTCIGHTEDFSSHTDDRKDSYLYQNENVQSEIPHLTAQERCGFPEGMALYQLSPLAHNTQIRRAMGPGPAEPRMEPKRVGMALISPCRLGRTVISFL